MDWWEAWALVATGVALGGVGLSAVVFRYCLRLERARIEMSASELDRAKKDLAEAAKICSDTAQAAATLADRVQVLEFTLTTGKR